MNGVWAMLRVQRKRNWVFSLLVVNVAMLLLALLRIPDRAADSGEILATWLTSFLGANATAALALLVLPPLLERLMARRRLQVLTIGVGILFFGAVGCLIMLTVPMLSGAALVKDFWSEYWAMLRSALPFALVFGLGAYFLATVHARLGDTEMRLREKEMAQERTKKLAAEARLHSLESRIHPHFLFNTLNSLSSLIVNSPARAEEMLHQLSRLLRACLDHTRQPLVPLHQELAMVTDYVEIEKVRFAGAFHCRIDVPDELFNVRVPPLSVQSLVENAMKHAIFAQRDGSALAVSASAQDGRLLIQVCDTGPGFSLSAVQAGHGLDNLVSRLDALFGPQAQLNVLRRDGWCVVQMELPLS
jgi:sensor histidine kinase YesM